MITIYGRLSCVYCEKAQTLCEDYKLEYEYKGVENMDYFHELMDKAPEAKSVPQIFWDEKHIGGYADFVTELENLGIGNYGQGDF